jgi:hypothetical protein
MRFFVALVSLLCWAMTLPLAASDDPWRRYNEGVQDYSASDFRAAFEQWQNLSLQKLPRGLERPVWFQLGNVQFRLGEPLEQTAPEEAVELWRRSCAAYQAVLSTIPRDQEARHNLSLVQRRLALLAHRLGLEALQAADGQALDNAIQLLHTSTEHLDEAAHLAPTDAIIQKDREQAWRQLRERLKDRALAAETKADQSALQRNPWSDQQAEDDYRLALDDLADARQPPPTPQAQQSAPPAAAPDALEQSIAAAQDRVSDKLSKLLTRRGKQEHQQGAQQATWNPNSALDHYESALSHYQAAQQVQPQNVEARNGEREVRQAMEQLHVKEGRAELERGKQALAQQSPRAASSLANALSHFESALHLNVLNREAESGAEEAKRLLPEALNLAGQSELSAGDRAEPQSASEALNHYQEAAKSFGNSLELKPKQPPAEEGLRTAESKLARVREKLAKEAEAAAKAGQTPGQPSKTLQSLLGQVEEKKRQPALERERQQGQRNTQPRKPHADW